MPLPTRVRAHAPFVLTCIGVLAALSKGACTGGLLSRGDGSGSTPRNASTADDGSANPVPANAQCASGEQPNGLDDNRNGRIDEGCPCKLDAVQRCWGGSEAERGRGQCRDGTQTCVQDAETIGWGPCRDSKAAAAEVADNGIDEDCDGIAQMSNGDDRYCTRAEFGDDCATGNDSDCDGLVGCAEDREDCAHALECADGNARYEICRTSEDEDGDGFGGCADSECKGNPSCTGQSCVRGEGGRIDCSNLACRWEEKCLKQEECVSDNEREVCTDGHDNDGNCLADCNDEACENHPHCKVGGTTPPDDDDGDDEPEPMCGSGERCKPGGRRWCDTAAGCLFGIQVCTPQGTWGACVETTHVPGATSRTVPSGCRCDPHPAGGCVYNLTCCIGAGECCEDIDFPGPAGTRPSIGPGCDKVLTCRR